MLETVSLPSLTGKILTVDSVNGIDTVARPYFEDLPYLTLSTAKTSAVSGDTIHVRPGSYAITTDIAKSGIGWNADVGASISRDDAAVGVGSGIFDDGGSAMSFTVAGAGIFSRSIADDGETYVAKTSHASSVISVTCRSIQLASGDTTQNVYGAACFAGTMYVKADYIGTEASSGHTFPVWWFNGDMHVVAGRINGGGGLESSGIASTCDVSPTGNLYVTADEIIGDPAVYCGGVNSIAACWVSAPIVRGTGAVNGSVWIAGNNRCYVTSDKLFGRIYLSSGSSLVYIRSQKIAAISNDGGDPTTAQILYTGSSYTGTAFLELEDVTPEAFTGHMITVEGGTIEIRGMRYVANSSSNGIMLTGGTLRLINCTIDTSANNATNPINKSGGTLELINCTLVAESTRNAIESGSAQSVIFKGVIEANRPINSNVTVTYDSAPIRQMLTPAQIVANQNDYNPGRAKYYRLSTDASRTITGLVAGADGEPRHIVNVGSQNIVLAHESGLSSAVNRFLTIDGASATILPTRMVGLLYDSTTARWRVYT